MFLKSIFPWRIFFSFGIANMVAMARSSSHFGISPLHHKLSCTHQSGKTDSTVWKAQLGIIAPCSFPVNEYYHILLTNKVTVLFVCVWISTHLATKHITVPLMKWTKCDSVSCGLAFPRFCLKAPVCIFLKIIFVCPEEV